MIPGYNHNVKYKDRVYHVQTEDSGVQNPHVITHLFVGGNIVESRKTSYANLVGHARLTDELVAIMQGQHKGMLKDLINGRFDDKILERSVNAATLNGPAPLNVEAGAQHRASFGIGGTADATATANTKPKGAPAQPKTPAPAPIAVTPPAHVQPAAARPAPLSSIVTPLKHTAGSAPLQAPRPPTPPSQQLPAVAAQAPHPGAATPQTRPAQPIQASPTFGAPPPKRPTAQPTAGAPAAIARPVPPPTSVAITPASFAKADGGLVLEAETLARAFESQNESAVDSIFGEDLISEKSLDEVILSYLADDLQKDT